MVKKIPTFRKNNRPVGLVLGAAGLGGVWGGIKPSESVETILFALENDIDRIDTAPAYSRSEELIGKALDEWTGVRPYISTKVGRLNGDSALIANHNYQIDVMAHSVQRSMELLRCEKLDLLFLHEPEMVPLDQISGVIDFLVDLKARGIVNEIGFGGMPTQNYFEFVRAGLFDVVMGYNNLDAACIDGMAVDIPFLKNNQISIYQGSPLHMGLLGNRYDLYTTKKPEWMPQKVLENAKSVFKLSNQFRISLPALAHRFILSIQEVDHMVLGAKNMIQLKQTLNDCTKGILVEKIFQSIVEKMK